MLDFWVLRSVTRLCFVSWSNYSTYVNSIHVVAGSSSVIITRDAHTDFVLVCVHAIACSILYTHIRTSPYLYRGRGRRSRRRRSLVKPGP